MSSFYQFETPLTVHADPINPMHAVSKQYVDNKATNINGSRFVSGTIGVEKLPSLTGDVTSVVGTNELILKNSGVAPGVYTGFTVDGKGPVVAGTFTPVQTTDLSWLQVQNTPTTLGGYGITDVISRDVGDTVKSVTMTGVQATDNNAVVTKATVDELLMQVDLNGVQTGEVVRHPSTSTPEGFLRSNGGILDRSTYAALYAVIGDTYSTGAGGFGYMGQPWRQQYAFNTQQSNDVTGWSSGTSLPATVYDSQAIVTKNRVYLLGGVVNGGSSGTVYTAPILSDGTLGTWTTGTSLPATVAYSQAIVTKNRVYLLGGSSTPAVYTAPVNADGTLGAWTTGISLPTTVSYSQAIVTKNRVYLLGGVVNGTQSSAVYTAPINADGTLGTWTTGTSLPSALSHSQAIVTKNRVYLLGGVVNGSASPTVYTAPIYADGTLGAWTTGTSLPATVYGSQAIVTKNRVYLLGGHNGSSPVAAVYTAPINADGTLGTWTTGTPLPATVFQSQVLVTSNRVYLLGGYVNSSTSSTVHTAPFSGGTNDYLALIADNTVDSATQFKLPDYSARESAGLYYYIKY